MFHKNQKSEENEYVELEIEEEDVTLVRVKSDGETD